MNKFMRSSMFFNFLCLVSFGSCDFNSNTGNDGRNENFESRTIVNKSPHEDVFYLDTLKKLIIDNDEFVYKILDNELTLDLVRVNFTSFKQKVIKNKYSSTKCDTIIVYNNGLDTIDFYISEANTILREAIINSQLIILDSNIRVGVSKELFMRKFELSTIPDLLVVKDFENTSYFVFTFKDDLLIKIFFEVRYLD
jgi:hypothetical protein